METSPTATASPTVCKKYGRLYEDFVGTCMANFHPLGGHNDPLTGTQLRPCNLDSNVNGFRAVRENLVDMTDSSEEFVDATIAVYRDGYRNNHNAFWYDDLTGGTGLTKQNYGWGENFYSTSPYWYATRPRNHTHTFTILSSNLAVFPPRVLTGLPATRRRPRPGTSSVLKTRTLWRRPRPQPGRASRLAVEFPEPPPEPPVATLAARRQATHRRHCRRRHSCRQVAASAGHRHVPVASAVAADASAADVHPQTVGRANRAVAAATRRGVARSMGKVLPGEDTKAGGGCAVWDTCTRDGGSEGNEGTRVICERTHVRLY